MSIDETLPAVANTIPTDNPPSYEDSVNMASETTNGAAPQVGAETTADEPTTYVCAACTLATPFGNIVELKCGDSYCPPCLTNIFKTAMADEIMFPPSCCSLRISLRKARSHLPKAVSKLFREKELELATKNKTYCWKPRCSAFIAPHSIHNGEAYCQKCRAVTCSVCKSRSHFGKCTYAGDESFLEFISTTKFKKCPVCRRMVEKNGGCNHIVCRCRTEMCYGCGEKFDDCICSGTEDDDDDYEDMGDGMLFD